MEKDYKNQFNFIIIVASIRGLNMPIDEHSIITMFDNTFSKEFSQGCIALISSDGLALYVTGCEDGEQEFEAISSIMLSNILSTQKKVNRIDPIIGEIKSINMKSEDFVISCMELIEGFYVSLKVVKDYFPKISETIGTFRDLLSAIMVLQEI